VGLALGATALFALILLWSLAVPEPRETFARVRDALRRGPGRTANGALVCDPGRERRAEQRARALLRSCVNEEEWAMYRDLGFLRIWGGLRGRDVAEPPGGAAEYAYLVYPHKPIVAYLPQTATILGEYCVTFNERRASEGLPRLPDADDVLAKWMLLSADERGLLAQANMHLPGRQIDPEQVRRDIARLSQWERRAEPRRAERADSVPAP
jgi:hypothetical protein